MDGFLIFLEFMLNNVFQISVIFLSVFLMLYFFQKSYREIAMNRKLRTFQKRLRNMNIAKKKKRMAILSVMVIVPIVSVLAFFQLIRSPQITYEYHVSHLNDAEDITMIYESYHQKFTKNVSLRESSIQAFDAQRTVQFNAAVYSENDMPTVKYDTRYIYVLNSDRLVIVNPGNETYPIHKNIDEVFDGIGFFNPIELYIDQDYVVVVGNGYETLSVLPYNHPINTNNGDNISTYVFVFDKNDNFALSSKYVINGNLDAIHKNEHNLLVSVNHHIPFNDEALDVHHYLPTIDANGTIDETLISDIRYIEGTEPNSFTTLLNINIKNSSYDKEVLFGDYKNYIEITDQGFYLLAESYEFIEATEMFTVSEPVNMTRTAITKFNYTSDTLNYHSTKMVRGALVQNDSILIDEDGLRLVTTEKRTDSITHRLYVINHDMNTVSRITDIDTDGHNLSSVQFFNDYTYLIVDRLTDVVIVYNLTNIYNPIYEDTIDYDAFSHYVYAYDNEHILSIDLFDFEEDGLIDGIRIAMLDVSDITSPQEMYNETIIYKDFGLNFNEMLFDNNTIVLSQRHKMLIVPINSYNVLSRIEAMEGVLIFSIDNDEGLVLEGFISHTSQFTPYASYRAIIHNNFLYVISHDAISVSRIDSVEDIMYQFSLINKND